MEDKKKEIPIEEKSKKNIEIEYTEPHIEIDGEYLELRFRHKAFVKLGEYLNVSLYEFIDIFNIGKLTYKEVVAVVWCSLSHTEKYGSMTYDEFLELIENSDDISIRYILDCCNEVVTAANQNKAQKKTKKRSRKPKNIT